MLFSLWLWPTSLPAVFPLRVLHTILCSHLRDSTDFFFFGMFYLLLFKLYHCTGQWCPFSQQNQYFQYFCPLTESLPKNCIIPCFKALAWISKANPLPTFGVLITCGHYMQLWQQSPRVNPCSYRTRSGIDITQTSGRQHAGLSILVLDRVFNP